MKRNNFLYAGMLLLTACGQNATVSDPDIYSLENPVDTLLYEQAPFEWHVTPRHDYSKTYVTKLFMSQALFDPEYMGRFKMRDNGQQTNFLNCEQALDVIKGMDAITLGLPKIVYLVGWQYLGHDSKYPAFFEGNAAIKRPQDKDALESLRWLMDEGKKCHTAASHLSARGMPIPWSRISFSENGYENKTWTVPAGVKLSGQVKAWLIDANGRTEFKTFQLRKHQLTLSLAPGEMVLIQG